MNIESKEYIMNLSHNELWLIAFSVKASLETDLKTHYVNHQNSWEKTESNKLELLRIMFNSLGVSHCYDEIFKHAEKIFTEFNNEKRGLRND